MSWYVLLSVTYENMRATFALLIIRPLTIETVLCLDVDARGKQRDPTDS